VTARSSSDFSFGGDPGDDRRPERWRSSGRSATGAVEVERTIGDRSGGGRGDTRWSEREDPALPTDPFRRSQAARPSVRIVLLNGENRHRGRAPAVTSENGPGERLPPTGARPRSAASVVQTVPGTRPAPPPAVPTAHSSVGALASSATAAWPSHSSESVMHSTHPWTVASLPPNTFRNRVLTDVPHRLHRPSGVSSGWDMEHRWGSWSFVIQSFPLKPSVYDRITPDSAPRYSVNGVRLPGALAVATDALAADTRSAGLAAGLCGRTTRS
jgi:hypothetical protein